MTCILDWNEREAYSEPYTTSIIVLSLNIENIQLYLDEWWGSEHASVMLYLPLKSGSHVQKLFAKLKFSPVLFEQIPSFVYLVFKNENKW